MVTLQLFINYVNSPHDASWADTDLPSAAALSNSSGAEQANSGSVPSIATIQIGPEFCIQAVVGKSGPEFILLRLP